MKKYILLVSGVNAKVTVEGEGLVQKCTFHTTRCIEAENPEAARDAVRDQIDQELEGTLKNHRADPVVIGVDWMKEVASFDEYDDLPYRGEYAWYRG